MSLLMENSVAKIGCGDPGDPIEFACRFDGGHLKRVFATDGRSDKVTVFFWVKRSALSYGQAILSSGVVGSAASGHAELRFDLSDFLVYAQTPDNFSPSFSINTESVHKDPAAWSCTVIHLNSTVSGGSAQGQIYQDGVLVSTMGAEAALNLLMDIGGDREHAVGDAVQTNSGSYVAPFSGHLAEFGVIIGEIVPVTDFMRVNAYGQWVHKEFSGKGGGAAVYGTNGFHLDFADPLDLGKDASGNANHFTVNGIVTQVTDTPTNNFSTGNPLDAPAPAGRILSEGNSVWQPAHNPGEGHIASTMLIPDGKFYWEVTPLSGAPFSTGTIIPGIGFAHRSVAVNGDDGSVDGLFHYQSNGSTAANPIGNETGFPAWTVNDVISVAIDGTTGDCWFAKNGVWISGNPETGTDPVFTIPSAYLDGLRASVQDSAASGAISARVNFGQSAFVHQIPGGFATLSTGSMSCPVILDPSRYVQAPITIGGGAVTSLWNCITNKTLVISKRRDTVADFRLNVVIGGVQYIVAVNVDGTEVTDADGLSFTTNGFVLGSDTQYQGTCEHFVRRASPLAGMDFVLIDNHVVGQVSTIAHNCGGSIHRAWDIPLDGGDIRQFHHKMPAGDYTLVNVAGRGNDPDWFSSTPNTVSIGGASVAGRHLLILERGVPQFSSFDVYDGNGVVDGPMSPADFAPLQLDVVRGDAVGPHTVRTLRSGEANPLFKELSYDSQNAENVHSDKFYLLSNGAKCATNSAETGGQYTNANGGKYYTGMHALCPGKFANAR